MATANAVSLIASISAAANAEVAEKLRKGRPQRESSPITQDVRKKRSEKEKKSISHSSNTKDHDGKKTPASEEILTQFFETDANQSVFCPSVNVEKSRGDENEVMIVNEQEDAAKRQEAEKNGKIWIVVGARGRRRVVDVVPREPWGQ